MHMIILNKSKISLSMFRRVFNYFSIEIKSKPKQRIVTGIQPTGTLTIGNYLGSIQNLIHMQRKHSSSQAFIFIADLHSLTTSFDLEHSQIRYDGKIGENTLEIAKNIISSGVILNNQMKKCLFVQSQVKEHAQLCWILGSIGPQNWLNMMIQYKEKSSKNSSLGIYSYPVLMAADILIYKANYVPVGQDQKQHLQLTKKYAQRFNNIVGQQYFPIPQCIVSKAAKIMSLTDPSKKMSKSDSNQRSRINMPDNKDTISQKIRRSVTDSQGNSITYEPERRKGLANLIHVYSSFKDISNEQAVTQFRGQGIKNFKEALIQIISTRLTQIKNLKSNLTDQETRKILKQGAQAARRQASKTIDQVKKLLKLYT